MPSLDLTLDLDRTDPRYRPGELVSGRVHVQPGTRLFGRALVIAMWWEAHGEGDTDRGNERQIVLAAGNGSIGGQAFPFAFRAPLGPLSYAGQHFAIDWILEARLSLPQVVGDTAKQHIIVEADPVGQSPQIAVEQTRPAGPARHAEPPRGR